MDGVVEDEIKEQRYIQGYLSTIKHKSRIKNEREDDKIVMKKDKRV